HRSGLDPRIVAHILGSICVGVPCGLFLWILVAFWPAARHPIRAASLCASLGGTLTLYVLCVTFPELMWSVDVVPALVCLGGVLVEGAVFGFVTAMLARFLERFLLRLIHDD